MVWCVTSRGAVLVAHQKTAFGEFHFASRSICQLFVFFHCKKGLVMFLDAFSSSFRLFLLYIISVSLPVPTSPLPPFTPVLFVCWLLCSLFFFFFCLPLLPFPRFFLLFSFTLLSFLFLFFLSFTLSTCSRPYPFHTAASASNSYTFCRGLEIKKYRKDTVVERGCRVMQSRVPKRY